MQRCTSLPPPDRVQGSVLGARGIPCTSSPALPAEAQLPIMDRACPKFSSLPSSGKAHVPAILPSRVLPWLDLAPAVNLRPSITAPGCCALTRAAPVSEAHRRCRVAWICPEPMAPHLEHYMGPWCMALRSVRDDVEKEHAFLGLAALLRINPLVRPSPSCKAWNCA